MIIKRWLRWTLTSFVAILLISSLILGWLIASQSGFQWILSRIILPSIPELTVDHFEGRLIGAITLRDIHYKNNTIELTVKNLNFDWHPSKLFSKTIEIDTVKASHITVAQIAAPAVAKKSTKPSLSIEEIFNQLKLPVNINVNNLEVSDGYFSAYQSDQAIQIQRFKLIGTTSKKLLSIKEIKLESDLVDLQGNVNLSLEQHNRSKDDINGQLSWAIKAPAQKTQDIKTVSGETILSGNIDNIKINNSLAAPYDSSIDVTINDLFNNLVISSAIHLKKIQVSDINTEWPSYQVKGTMNIKGNMDTATVVSHLKIEELRKNIIINTEIKSSWKDNQLTVDALTDIPGILEQLVLKGSIQPKLLEIEGSEAIALALTWQKLNISDGAKNTGDNASLIENDSTHANKKQPSNIKLSSPEGKLLITGNLDSYLFSLDTLINTDLKKQLAITQKNLAQGDLIQGALSLNGFGNTDKITLEDIALSGSIGILNGHGSVNFKPELIVALDLSGKNINPEIISAGWPGDLSLDISINTTKAQNGSPLIQTNISSSGNLRKRPFSLSTAAELIVDKNEKHRLTIEKLLLNSGGSKISASGMFEANETLSAKWSISSNNLEELIPETKGKINTKGSIAVNLPLSSSSTIQELLHAIKTEATLRASGIEAFDTTIDTLTVTADINWQENNDRNNVTVYSKKVSLDALDIESLSATLAGEPESHQLIVDLQSSNGNINLLLSGQLNNKSVAPRWKFTVESATLDIPKLAPWYLQRPVSGALSEDSQFISSHCWLSDSERNNKKAKICLEANNKNNLSRAKFTLLALPAEYFSVFSPDEISWTGSIINGQGNIALTTDKLSSSQQIDADIKLMMTAGKLSWQTSPTQDDLIAPNNNTLQKSIQLEAGSFSISSDKKELKALLKLPIEKQSGIDGSLIITNNNNAFIERDIQGKLRLALDNIAPFNFFIPDSKDLKGKLDSHWYIGGSIAKPRVDGKLSLTKGQLLLNSPGILLEDITLKLNSDKQSGIKYQASLNSGGGALRVDGTLKLPDGGQAPELNLSLKGERVKVFDTQEAIVFASPDLIVTTNNDSININGSVTIPEASVTPQKIPESVVSISEDQIIVDTVRNEQSNQSQQNIVANIDIILGKNVRIDGFGFKGTTTGSLNIIKQHKGPVLGNGEIKIINGEYRAFGQGLIIDKGSILFTGGSVTKPGIDIKALRRPAENVTVGIFARGSLSQPNLTIFSDPSMPQAEQLSWLVLGRSIEQSSEGEGSAISQLLLSLSLSGGNSAIGNLSETFNLDTLSLQSGSGDAGSASDNDVAELVLGKYLSPDLYVSYGIGLFKPVNVLSIEYSLSRYWKLTTETTTETSGGDIVYTIEK
jgi:translocation and assembly module TamB